jgi:hypothetical protein
MTKTKLTKEHLVAGATSMMNERFTFFVDAQNDPDRDKFYVNLIHPSETGGWRMNVRSHFGSLNDYRLIDDLAVIERARTLLVMQAPEPPTGDSVLLQELKESQVELLEYVKENMDRLGPHVTERLIELIHICAWRKEA